jgi:hypothetical protein
MSTSERGQPGRTITLPRGLASDDGSAGRSPSAFTARTIGVFLPTIALLCVWTSYSEGVVSSTSFHSLSPPMNIVVALFFLAAVALPVHHGLRAGRRWAAGLLALGLFVGLWLAGDAALAVWAMALGHRVRPHPPLAAALLLALLLMPPTARRLRRTAPLSPAELIAVYMMLMVGTLATSYGVAHFMIPTLVSARYYSGMNRSWPGLFFRYIPPWFAPLDREAIQGFWKGDVYQVPWSEWAGPLFAWTVLVLAAVWVMICLCALLQRQWIDRERLTFPLVQLPLALARPPAGLEEGTGFINPLFRQPLLWAGFMIPVLLHTMEGLHTYYPSSPTFQFRHINITESLEAQPWRSIGSLDVTFYPCIVGISYLLTLETSLSVWFFYVVRKLEPVLGVSLGWSEYTSPNGFVFPFADHQATGAWAAIVATTLWVGRRELRIVLRRAIQGGPPEGAALAPRTALVGAVAGVAVMVAWLRAAGMTPWVALAFLAIFFLWCVALTRIRAEAGMGGLTGPMTPQETLFLFAGTPVFGPQNLTLLQHIKWMAFDLRALPTEMPSMLEDLKMGDTMRLEGRSMVAAILFAILASMLLVYLVLIPLVYQHGGITMNSQRFNQVPTQPFRELATMLRNPRKPDAMGETFVGLGFATTLLLSALRLRFVGWPFHPIGYAVGFSRRTIDWMWFSIFLGWAAKLVLLRFGGMRLYRRALPFFLGFILGEFTMGGVFGFIGVLFPDTAGYQTYP